MSVPSIPASLVASAFGHDPARVRELARDILADSPFREQRPSPTSQLLERAGRFLGELLGRLLEVVGGDTAIAWIIVAVGSVLLLAAVWRWTRGVRLAGAVAAEVTDPSGRTADDWIEASDRAAAAGDLDEALRRRYLAVVATLVEGHVLGDVPGRTIRELDADLAEARPDMAEPVARSGARLERVTFGGSRATPEDVEVVDDALRVVTARQRVRA